MKMLTFALLASSLLAAGCSKSEPAAGGDGAAKPAARAELPPLPEPDVAGARPHAEKGADDNAEQAPKPMMKETEASSDGALGTLPTGIGIREGSPLPDVTLMNLEGAPVTLSSFVSEGPALFVFYRGGWCPYCNFQVQAMTKAHAQFAERRVTPVMISVDSVDEAAKTSATYDIPFPVLSDSNLHAHKAFNVAFEVDDETLAKYKTYGIDLEKASGEDHHNLAIPSVFLVDAKKKVVWAHADRDYKTRPTPEQLLAAIDRALGASE